MQREQHVRRPREGSTPKELKHRVTPLAQSPQGSSGQDQQPHPAHTHHFTACTTVTGTDPFLEAPGPHPHVFFLYAPICHAPNPPAVLLRSPLRHPPHTPSSAGEMPRLAVPGRSQPLLAA